MSDIQTKTSDDIDHFHVNEVMRKLGFGWYEGVWENGGGYKYGQDEAAYLVQMIDERIKRDNAEEKRIAFNKGVIWATEHFVKEGRLNPKDRPPCTS